MDDLTRAGPGQYRNDVFRVLAHEERRAILRILTRWTQVDAEELAALLVAELAGKPLLDVTQSEEERAQASLTHRHLPSLTDANLVTAEGGFVSTTQHPAFDDPTITRIIESTDAGWDDVMRCLASEARRITLTSLYENGGQIDRTELASDVAEAMCADSGTGTSAEEVLPELHHSHIPMLVDAGLVSYDDREGTVTYEGHPDLDEQYLVVGGNDTPRGIPSLAEQ